MTDPIADMLIRIKNGYLARKKTVSLPYSRIKEELAKILKKKGFLGEIEVEEKKGRKSLALKLKYRGKKPALTKVERVSKPGLRVYADVRKLKKIIPGLGVMIISTPQGLMTLKEAKKANLGGEIICQVW